MRADFTPPPPDRSKDYGYVDVTVNTMPDAETLAKARADVDAHMANLVLRNLAEAEAEEDKDAK